ncbi:MAG: hypothetical protein AMXMBFR8_20760 [Nevskiales bacterium]
MSILFILIPLGLVLLIAAVLAFFWAARGGQFDDLESPAWRILMDDDQKPPRSDENRQ